MIISTLLSWTGLFLATAIAFGGLQLDDPKPQMVERSATQLVLAR